MPSTLPGDLPEHLSRQVDPVAGYTRYDEILESIGSNVIRCPLSLEATKSMCLFNDRCYDTGAFEVTKERSASACRSREQRGLVCVRNFQDPIDKKSIWLYDFAMKHLYKTVMVKSGYAEFIHRKIPSVTIDDAVQIFVPTPKKESEPNINVNEFVTFIQNKLKGRVM